MSLKVLFLKLAKLQHPIRNHFFSPHGKNILHKNYLIDSSKNLTECCLDAFLSNDVAVFLYIENLFCYKQKIYFVINKKLIFFR